MPRSIEYCALKLHEMWAAGETYEAMAAALGCSKSCINHLKNRHKLPNRQRSMREIFENDPTPEQIAERAAECIARREGPPEPKGERFSIPRYQWTGSAFRALS